MNKIGTAGLAEAARRRASGPRRVRDVQARARQPAAGWEDPIRRSSCSTSPPPDSITATPPTRASSSRTRSRRSSTAPRSCTRATRSSLSRRAVGREEPLRSREEPAVESVPASSRYAASSCTSLPIQNSRPGWSEKRCLNSQSESSLPPRPLPRWSSANPRAWPQRAASRGAACSRRPPGRCRTSRPGGSGATAAVRDAERRRDQLALDPRVEAEQPLAEPGRERRPVLGREEVEVRRIAVAHRRLVERRRTRRANAPSSTVTSTPAFSHLRHVAAVLRVHPLVEVALGSSGQIGGVGEALELGARRRAALVLEAAGGSGRTSSDAPALGGPVLVRVREPVGRRTPPRGDRPAVAVRRRHVDAPVRRRGRRARGTAKTTSPRSPARCSSTARPGSRTAAASR